MTTQFLVKKGKLIGNFETDFQVLEQSTEVHRALEEALLFLMVMCIPVSYVAGMVAGIFCNLGTGDDFEQEMELNKVDDGHDSVFYQRVPCNVSIYSLRGLESDLIHILLKMWKS
jgi:hypothetical protein